MRLSIRGKIVLTFILFFILSSFLWSLNYYNYHVLNQKLQILEEKSELFNTILEARRYEKNYFLFFDYSNLREALSYVSEGEKKLAWIIDKHSGYTLAKNLTEELERLRDYKKALLQLRGCYQGDNDRPVLNNLNEFTKCHETIRNLGNRITSDMELMLAGEQQLVNRLVRQSKTYQFASLAGLLVLSVFTALFLMINVIRPLKSIENAIHKISHGDYATIPALSTGDEFESLVVSLNNMINELNRRSEQLIQTKKLASLGTLTSGVAHELNNPLNNISTSVQILLEELEEADQKYQRELLTQTEIQIERARDIVKALLEFSRDRSFALETVHFGSLVKDTIKLIRGEVPTNVEVRTDVPEDIEAHLDVGRIQQVLLNLILNSVQAMGDGGILDITAGKEQEGFWFRISDTGSGISQKALPKIFDPFFTTKDVGKGTGLGLSVTHGIIEQHGGRIEVESQTGKGTAFTVHLPWL